MQLVDAHCHLEAEDFSGKTAELIQAARAVGVVRLITAATKPEEWPLSRALPGEHPEVVYALGIHPWFGTEDHLGRLGELHAACRNGAVAVGEIGLDGKIESPSMDLQRRLFEAQLRVARETDLPVVIHARGAYNETLECLKRVGAPLRGGMVHAFSGSAEVAEAFIRHGLSFSMGGALTYRKSRKRAKTLARIYPGHLLLETDSPDMPPIQIPEKPNIPANIVYSLQGAAGYLECSPAEIAEQTTRNARRLFGLQLETP